MIRTAIVTVCAVLVLSLAACVPQPEAPSPRPTATVTTATASPTAVPAPVVEPGATPIGFGCEEFVTAQAMYEFNSIYNAVDFVPAAGTPAAEAVASEGIACRWTNTSSGTNIDFSVAMPAGLDARIQSLAGTEAGAFDGYYDAGVAQVVSGGYWVSVASEEFLSDADAAPLVELALDGLP